MSDQSMSQRPSQILWERGTRHIGTTSCEAGSPQTQLLPRWGLGYLL